MILIVLSLFVLLTGSTKEDDDKSSSEDIRFGDYGQICGDTYSTDVIEGWKFDRLHKNGFKDHGCQIVSSSDGFPVRSGSQSIRFEIQDGDCSSSDTYDDCANDRSRHELTQVDAGQVDGEEYWYHFSIYAPSTNLVSGAEVVFLGQFQQDPSGVAPFMFEAFDDGYGFRQNDKDYNIIFQEALRDNSLFKGQWTDVLMHIKWSSGSDGFVKVYFNGTLTKELTGDNMQNSETTLFHFGIYNAFISQCNCSQMPNQIFYFDEIRIGTTRASVEPTN